MISLHDCKDTVPEYRKRWCLMHGVMQLQV